MAKASFAKLNLKVNNSIKTIVWNETAIEIKQYLPIEEKITLVSNVINNSIDDNDFYNPIRLEIYTTLEIVYMYTNFNITEKMKEDCFKIYDIIISSGLYDKIVETIPERELTEIQDSIHKVIDNIYSYKNSAAGILNLISKDYSNLNLDLKAINDTITDPNQLALLKEIAPLLGLNE